MSEKLSMDETAWTLNRLAREQMKHRLLCDILTDLTVCEIEGWDKAEYINELMAEVKGLAEVKRAYDNAGGAVPNESKRAIFQDRPSGMADRHRDR